MAQAFMLRRQSQSLKSDVQTLSTELTTGRVADVAARIKGDFAPLNGIDSTLSRLGAYGASTAEAALFSESMQTALTTIEGLAASLSPLLLNGSTAGNPV
ncbi:MAG: flagellar biosynthesis protein FlgL, partial [Paracoccaceae bacterium]|nr:flagellar biosynthesis protein FlgL [Paracoccaceae bacterium]